MLLTMLSGADLRGQDGPLVAEPMPLSSPARSNLAAIQDNWLQWDSAFQRGEEGAAEGALADLVQSAAEVGMTRLPEVGAAILARATLSAADGNTQRAHWALQMAERIDPGRPDVEFAGAAVAREEGSYLAMIGDEIRGYARVGRSPLLRRLTAENLLDWALASVLLAGTLFVALQLATHGGSLVDDLAEAVSRRQSVTTAYLVALVVVILPIVVPAAWVALPIYWAILLLPYARPSERTVVASVMLVLVATPFLLAAQARRVSVELGAPMQAVRSLEERSLYGGLIKDVDALRLELESSPAVLHLIADLHQDLGQTEYARLLYQRLIEVEPLNVAAHNNIGAYYLRRRETSQAIDQLERAAAIDESRIEPYRNLWVLYRDYLAFEEAERVLARVRAFAPDRVGAWFTEGPSTIAVMRDGYDRAPEIRAALLQKLQSRPEPESGQSVSRGRALAVGAFLAVAVVLAALLARHGGRRARRPRDGASRLALIWVPGLISIRAGRGWRAFLALLVPMAALLLPRLTTLGYRLPWGYDPGSTTVWGASVLLLGAYVGMRALTLYRRSADVG